MEFKDIKQTEKEIIVSVPQLAALLDFNSPKEFQILFRLNENNTSRILNFCFDALKDFDVVGLQVLYNPLLGTAVSNVHIVPKEALPNLLTALQTEFLNDYSEYYKKN